MKTPLCPRRFVVAIGSTSVLGLAAFLGCAEGAKVDVTPDLLSAAPAIDSGKASEQDESAKVPPKKPPPPLEDENNDAGASSSSNGSSGISSTSSSGSTTSSSGGTSSGGTSTSSSTSSGGADAGVDSGGGTTSCTTTTTCTTGANSFDAGYVSGDTGSDVINLTGSTSHWIKVVVGEDSLSGASLKLTATLTSPPGTNFDLYLHSVSCASPTTSSTTTGVDTAKVVIPDATIGLPDDQWVLIEVRHVSGTCDPSAKWTLKLEGNK